MGLAVLGSASRVVRSHLFGAASLILKVIEMPERKMICLSPSPHSDRVPELEKLINEGWEPDPVWMPTNRPNIAENLVIYHVIKYTDEEKKAIDEAKQTAMEPVVKTPTIIDAIAVEVSNAEGIQEELYKKGFRLISDKIYQKTSIMLKPMTTPPVDNLHMEEATPNPEGK